MKLIYIVLLLCFNIFATQTDSLSQKPRVMLESISKYAIRMGTGDEKVIYMFVDPMCKYSNRFITKISENEIVQQTNTYYIFLYRLQKFDSQKLIQFIYQSDEPESAVIDVMVDQDIIDLDDFVASDETITAIQEIAKVAKEFDMTLRPYIVSFEKDSKYCNVSEGIISCVEEFQDFED